MPRRNAVLLMFLWLGGLLAIFLLLRTPSNKETSFLFGYSLIRLSIALVSMVAVSVLVVFSAAEIRQPAWWRRLTGRLVSFFDSPTRIFISIAFLFAAFLSIAAVLLLAVSPAAGEFALLKTVLNYLGFLLVWLEAVILVAGFFFFDSPQLRFQRREFFTPLRSAVLFSLFMVIYTAVLKIYMTLTWDIRMRRLEEYIFLPAVLFLAWGILNNYFQNRKWYPAARRILLLSAIGVATYTVYRHTAQWMEWQNTPSKSYWRELAYAFLQGRLYLINPGTTHDLTFYQGNWYVPNPPLPALILMPLVALFGAANINMVLFSITIGAVNVILVFLVLDKASRLSLIPTKVSGNLVITALFAFGTMHWWLSVMGRMWFISQLLTLTFASLALLAVLHRSSPWLAGLCLGLALLSRPNIFTLWPFLLGLALFFLVQPDGRINLRRALGWAVQSAVPVCLAVAGLLYYNFIRFGDFFDFGYVTINSADWLMEAVQTYGIFNAHFVPANLYVAFLKFPLVLVRKDCFYFSPTREGVSILSLTPALIYVFRRLKLNYWTGGAWSSILISIGLLMFYHNTGAWQVGYRYLMDFILPVLFLLAIGVGQRGSKLFHVLVLLSVLLNGAAIVWWFEKWYCS